MANKRQPLQVVAVVAAVVGPGTCRLGQQAFALVVADGLALGVGGSGKFADFHDALRGDACRNIALDFKVATGFLIRP